MRKAPEKPRTTRRAAPVIAAAAGVVSAALAPMAAAHAQSVPVDLELVLAVDVSQSMDFDEHRLQRMGYVEAFRHEDVVNAILFGPRGQIAVTYVEWGDAFDQVQIVPWTLIASREDAESFADALASEPIYPGQRTSISNALIRSANLIDVNDFDGTKRVIDISGDGPNNDGPLVETARDEVAGRGVTINGLPITLKDASSWYDIENLDAYYEDCVIAGPGSFVAPVADLEELGSTIRGKLVLEIAGLPARLHRAQIELNPNAPAAPETDCLIGEKLWQSRGGRFFR
jgi:hypothetical protein